MESDYKDKSNQNDDQPQSTNNEAWVEAVVEERERKRREWLDDYLKRNF